MDRGMGRRAQSARAHWNKSEAGVINLVNESKPYVLDQTVPPYYRPPSTGTGTFKRRFKCRSRLAQPDREMGKMKDALVRDARPFVARFPRNRSWKQGHPYKTLICPDEAPVGQAPPARLSAAPPDLSARQSGRLVFCEPGLQRACDLTRLISL